MKTLLKMALVLLVAIGVQTTFGSDLRVDDVAPDLMLLVTVLSGFIGGAETGAVVGFATGAVSDLFLVNTPFGLSCLAYCLTGFVVGWATASLLRPHWYLVPGVAGAGTALGVALFVVIGYLVGQAQLVVPGKAWLLEVVVVEALYAAVFGLPVATIVGWALARHAPQTSSPGSGPIGSLVESPGRRRASARARRRRRARAGVR